MKTWYFHGLYKTNGLGTNEISNNIFDLRHRTKLAADLQKKNKIFKYSLKYPNKESGKIWKTRLQSRI